MPPTFPAFPRKNRIFHAGAALAAVAWAVATLVAAAASRIAPSGALPTIPARFGEPVRDDVGTLQYPGFTVHLQSKTTSFHDRGQPPWVVWTYEVLNQGHLTIGGDITFNSDERVNARRFDVAGHIFVAEKHATTAGVKSGTPVPLTARLADDELVIWDEQTAEARNPLLTTIWRTEKINADARYSSQDAYTYGALIPGYGPAPGRIANARQTLAKGGNGIEPVPVLLDTTNVPAGVAHRYGERINFGAGALRFPDFTLALAEVEEELPANSADGPRRYRFRVFNSGERLDPWVTFDTADLANGASFTVRGKTYVAELFFSTVGAIAPDGKLPLGPEDMIVWDEATARRNNPRILGAFNPANTGPFRPTRFAAGVPLGVAFTGEYQVGAAGWRNYHELDEPLRIVQDGPYAYPSRYAGTGLVARVGGYFIVEPDGTVREAVTTGGTDETFQAGSAKAVRAMRFSVPMYHGQPTRALVNFGWQIKEPISDTRGIRLD